MLRSAWIDSLKGTEMPLFYLLGMGKADPDVDRDGSYEHGSRAARTRSRVPLTQPGPNRGLR